MSKFNPNIKERHEWVLCPSKRIPGQYYYFNVATGEAIWRTSEPKQQIIKEPQIPEKITPNLPNIETIRTLNRPANIPTFGKVSFQNYVPLEREKPSSSNTFDISTNLCKFGNITQMPMIVLPWQLMVDPKVSPTSEQITQTTDLGSLLVHSCQIPLSKRFGNYEKVVPTTSDEITSNNPALPTKSVDSTVGPIVGSTNDIKKPILREPVFNVKKNEVGAKSMNVNVEKADDNSQDVNLNLADLNLNDTDVETQRKDEEKHTSVKLQKDDLRLFLMARKRKYKESNDYPNSSEVKKIKLRRDDNIEKPVKKHVTFNLDNGVKFNPESSQNIFPDSNTKLTTPTLKAKEWYIAVDTKVLIENYEFINSFVQTDENCRLLIPKSSFGEIDYCASSFGSRNVLKARQVARIVRNPPRHVLVGNQVEAKSILFFSDTNIAAYDSLLNCCLEKIHQKYKVVLLSDDEDLLNSAQSLRIQSYKFGYIKENVKKCTDILGNYTSCNKLLNSKDSQPSVSVNKEQFTKPHTLCQNVIDNSLRVDNNNTSNDKNVVSKVSSNNIRTEQNKNTKNDFRANIIQTNDKTGNCQNLFQIQNHDLNSNDKNPFLFQKLCLEKGIDKEEVKTFQVQNQVPFEIQNSNKDLKTKQSVLPKINKTTKMEASSSNTAYNENEDFFENNLKRFEIKNKVMEVRIKERIEEWNCTFTQIMEDGLSNVLQMSSFQNDLILPWSLRETIEKVNKIYNDDKLKTIVKKLSAFLEKCVCDIGKVKKSVKPQDFVKVIGCGILLIECLQSLQANCEGLSNAKQSLTNLWRTIDDPNELESIEESSHYIHIENRQNYVKEQSEIIKYLKRHYENWNSYEMSEDQRNVSKNLTSTPEDPKVFRTVGKNLNTLRIDNKKSISVVKCQNNPESTSGVVIDNISTKYADITTKNVSEHPKKIINKTIEKNGKDLKIKENVSKETIVTKVNNKNSTEPDIRHINLVKETEKGFKAKTALNKNVLNNSDIDTKNNEHIFNIKDVSKCNNEKNTKECKNKDVELIIDDNIPKIDDSGNTKPKLNDSGKILAKTNDFKNKDGNIVVKNITISDSTSDSGIENESYMTYSYIKRFQCELSNILIAIHSFIVENLDDLRNNKNDEKKSKLHKKVMGIRKYLGRIIGQLKRIVQRETNGTTLNNLIIEIEEAANDKRISRYRSVIRKFLEQARILQNALKIILCVMENKFEDTFTICSDSTGSSIRYINIFE